MNPFAVLGLPERPTLTDAEVTERFQALSREQHPDRAHTPSDAFTEITQAYQALRSRGQRLKALLQLRFPDTFQLKGVLPEGLLELFSVVSQALQTADTYLEKKRRATTALAEALLAPELMRVQAALGEASHVVTARLQDIDEEIAKFETTLVLETASRLCRESLYLEKWQSQIQQRFHDLL